MAHRMTLYVTTQDNVALHFHAFKVTGVLCDTYYKTVDVTVEVLLKPFK